MGGGVHQAGVGFEHVQPDHGGDGDGQNVWQKVGGSHKGAALEGAVIHNERQHQRARHKDGRGDQHIQQGVGEGLPEYFVFKKSLVIGKAHKHFFAGDVPLEKLMTNP